MDTRVCNAHQTTLQILPISLNPTLSPYPCTFGLVVIFTPIILEFVFEYKKLIGRLTYHLWFFQSIAIKCQLILILIRVYPYHKVCLGFWMYAIESVENFTNLFIIAEFFVCQKILLVISRIDSSVLSLYLTEVLWIKSLQFLH